MARGKHGRHEAGTWHENEEETMGESSLRNESVREKETRRQNEDTWVTWR